MFVRIGGFELFAICLEGLLSCCPMSTTSNSTAGPDFACTGLQFGCLGVLGIKHFLNEVERCCPRETIPNSSVWQGFASSRLHFFTKIDFDFSSRKGFCYLRYTHKIRYFTPEWLSLPTRFNPRIFVRRLSLSTTTVDH